METKLRDIKKTGNEKSENQKLFTEYFCIQIYFSTHILTLNIFLFNSRCVLEMLKLIFIFVSINFVYSIYDEESLFKKVANVSSEMKIIEENFYEHEEIIHEILSEVQSELKVLTKSLNSSSLYPKLLKVIGEISEIINEISKHDDATNSKINGSACENVAQNIEHLQFFIKKFACCQSKVLFVTVKLSVKKISLKIQKALNYHYLKVSQDKILSQFVSCLDSLTSEYKKFLWFLLTSIARETFLLGKMVSYQIALCSKATPKRTSTKFTTEMSELDALTSMFSTKTSSREIEELDEGSAQFDLKYMKKPEKLRSSVKSNVKKTSSQNKKILSTTKKFKIQNF